MAPVLPDYGETRHVGRTVADIDHVLERNGAQFRGHVVIHVLRHVEQAFVDPKKKLRLLGVTDYALWKSDPALVVLGKFASENGAHVRLQTAAVEQHFQPAEMM